MRGSDGLASLGAENTNQTIAGQVRAIRRPQKKRSGKLKNKVSPKERNFRRRKSARGKEGSREKTHWLEGKRGGSGIPSGGVHVQKWEEE